MDKNTRSPTHSCFRPLLKVGRRPVLHNNPFGELQQIIIIWLSAPRHKRSVGALMRGDDVIADGNQRAQPLVQAAWASRDVVSFNKKEPHSSSFRDFRVHL
jgi:hypothetical protein